MEDEWKSKEVLTRTDKRVYVCVCACACWDDIMVSDCQGVLEVETWTVGKCEPSEARWGD